jgi:hypothetical protein
MLLLKQPSRQCLPAGVESVKSPKLTMDNQEMNDELLRLRALTIIQVADISALIGYLEKMEAALRPVAPNLPTFKQTFLADRKKLVQDWLEDTETKNPALAAQLQKLIDSSCKLHPFNYD